MIQEDAACSHADHIIVKDPEIDHIGVLLYEHRIVEIVQACNRFGCFASVTSRKAGGRRAAGSAVFDAVYEEIHTSRCGLKPGVIRGTFITVLV